MKFDVQLYYDGVLVDPSEISSLVIVSPTVHRIVNRVIRRCEEEQLDQNTEDADKHSPKPNRQDVEAVEVETAPLP